MNKRYWAATLAIPVVVGFCAASNVLADNSTTVTVNVSNVSLELDVPASPAILTLNPTATGANFGSVDLTATVGTNNPTGYQLSVEFSDTSLVRTAAVGSSTPEIDTLDELSGGYAENDFTVNRWGQKVVGDNYFPIPSTSLAPASWSSSGPVNNAENTITLAAKADGTVPAGDYEVTLTYTLVANVVEPYSDPYQNSNSDLTKSSEHAPGPKIGDQGGENTPIIYPANSLLRAFEIAYTNRGIPMYVEDSNVTSPIPGWRPMTEADVSTIGGKQVRFAMQDISMTLDGTANGIKVCDAAAPSTSVTAANTYYDEALVMDKRDGKSYWIFKGADGKCWMSQNLDLDLSDQVALTHATSDIGWTDNDPTAAWLPNKTTIPFSGRVVSGWSDNSYLQQSADPGERYVVSSGNQNDDSVYYNMSNCKQNSYTNTEDECRHYHIGNFYNWAAATATNDTSQLNTPRYIAPDSICPAGWRIPRETFNSASTEIHSLLVSHGIISTSFDYNQNSFSQMRSSPIYLVRGDGIGGGCTTSGGGLCWTGKTDGGYHLGTISEESYVDQEQYVSMFTFWEDSCSSPFGTRQVGYSVRCVAR